MSQRDSLLAKLKNVSLTISERNILDDVSLDIHANKILVLVGPNGAGKSSLISVLLGVTSPSEGHVWTRDGLKIGYVPQKIQVDSLLPMNVSQFISLGEANRKVTDDEISDILSLLEIEALASHPVQSVSGGEFQRVLLGRALLRKPELLILDEPAQGVDIFGQSALYQLIEDVTRKFQLGVLMVSHDLHLVMAAADQVLCLNGHICCSGHPEDVSHHPEYLNLFGHRAMEGLGVYSHNHDHYHDLSGDVKTDVKSHHSKSKHNLDNHHSNRCQH